MNKRIFISFCILTMTIIYGGENKQSNKIDTPLSPIVVAILETSLLTAHFFTPDSYSWHGNTISELRFQHYKHSWLMRMGPVGRELDLVNYIV